MIASLVLAAIAVLPADRLAMADRLFNKGRYAEASAEYEALKGEKGVAADELLYRFAECERSLGRAERAQQLFAELYERHPTSRHADRARLMHAMGLTADSRRAEALSALDREGVAADVRSAALYHLGVQKRDIEILARCANIDPKGRYAPYADLRRSTLMASSSDAAVRRAGIGILADIAFGNKGELSEEALYLAAARSYTERNFKDAGNLVRHYRKNYPAGRRTVEMRSMAVWCDYMTGRYADAAAACGEGEKDDFAYIRAASAYATGEDEKALALFKKYLVDYPEGRFRKDVELPLARLELKAAETAGNATLALECAKRCAALSNSAADGLRLAWAYEKAKHTQEAEAEYLRIAKRFEGSEEAAEALFRKAMMDAREDRWSAAELTLAEALATGKCGKRTGDALYWRGIAALRLDHGPEAATFLRKALECGLPLDQAREARLLVADADFNAGRRDEAKAAYAKLVAEGACDRMSATKVLAVGKMLDGDPAKACAEHLIRNESAQWRQAGYALLGSVEERREKFSLAIDAYRKCLAEKANVADAASAALNLGRLEMRAGEFDKADETLKRAINLNSADAEKRGAAYLALAQNCVAKKDFRQACAYATVVTTLYSDKRLCDEAAKILSAHGKEGE